MNSASRISKRKEHNHYSDSIQMTPMIDVVFQMLIYFVLTFEVPDRMSLMPVWRPGCGPGTPPYATQIQVGKGYVALENQRMSLTGLETYFHRLSDLNPNQSILVIAEGESHHHELVTVLDLLNKSGLEYVSLLSAD